MEDTAASTARTRLVLAGDVEPPEGLVDKAQLAGSLRIQLVSQGVDGAALGRELEGRTVTLSLTHPPRHTRRLKVSPRGEIVGSGLAPGIWTLSDDSDPADRVALDPLAPYVLDPGLAYRVEPGETCTASLSLARGRRVRGTVLDDSGAPVPDVRVSVVGRSPLAHLVGPAVEYALCGDGAGRVDGLLTPCIVEWVRISAVGYGSLSARDAGAEGLLERLTAGEVRLPRRDAGLALRVRLQTPEGSPVAGLVGLDHLPDGPTDPDRIYRDFETLRFAPGEGALFRRWQASDATVRAHGVLVRSGDSAPAALHSLAEFAKREPRAQTLPRTWYVEHAVPAERWGTSEPLDVKLKPAPKVMVRAIDPWGDPVGITHLAVRLQWATSRDAIRIPVPRNPPSSTCPLTLPPGRHVLTLAGVGCRSTDAQVHVSDAGAVRTVQLHGGARVLGQVVDANWQGIPGVTVHCAFDGRDPLGGSSPASRPMSAGWWVSTDLEGRFETVVTGHGRLRFTARRNDQRDSSTIDVEPDFDGAFDLELVLQEPGSIEVILPRGASTGTSAQLIVRRRDGDGLQRYRWPSNRPSMGQNSRAVFDSVLPGRYSVVGHAPGFEPIDREVEVESGETCVVEWFDAPPAPPLTGRLLVGDTPIAHCAVELLGWDHRPRDWAEVASDGRFELRGGYSESLYLAIREYSARLGLLIEKAPARVLPLAQASGDLGDVVLPAGSLHGTIVPRWERWRLEGVQVIASHQGAGLDHRTATPRAGRWDMRFLEPGSYYVTLLGRDRREVPWVTGITVEVPASGSPPLVQLRITPD